MTRIITIIALITISFNFASAQKFSAVDKVGEPIAKWDMIATNFGFVPNGATVSQSFTYTNDGTDGLQVMSATTTTPGVIVIPSKKTLANGESSAITVVYTPQYNGNFSAQIKVTTNASNSQQTLYIVGYTQKANN